jgi:dipeptidyl aminopeptidase/acylaminoacyl peptidase
VVEVPSLIRVKRLLTARPWLAFAVAAGTLGCIQCAVASSPTTDRLITPSEADNRWSVQAVVEVARIESVAIQESTHKTAYVLKQPSIKAGKNLYSLYVVDPASDTPPHKLLDALFLADVASRPRSDQWTVRADLGNGTQLYTVAANGGARAFVVSPQVALIGGAEGLQSSPTDEPRMTGVISYQWAPDGSAIWYSKVSLRSEAQQEQIRDQGLIYDDSTMEGATARDMERAVTLRGTELHVVDAHTLKDRLLVFAPPDPEGDFEVFRRGDGSAGWADSQDIQYRLRGAASGVEAYSLWRVNVANGDTERLRTESVGDVYFSVPTSEGFLTVDSDSGARRLVNKDRAGQQVADYGPVDFDRLGGRGRDVWRDERGGRVILAVEFEDHDGLATIGFDPKNTISTMTDQLSACAFDPGLTYGACSRESMSRAPELVAIDCATGDLRILARPNARYDAIPPLPTSRQEWTNRYRFVSHGYVTLPRDYAPGHSYPALVVTHSWDARNRFVYGGFQWQYPIQVFAELGYVVLAVNEPQRPRALARAGTQGASRAGPERQQLAEGFSPLATIEAAVTDAVHKGWVTPGRVGIAGFSRGATLARFAISHSETFRAASSGDATWWDVGGFWGGNSYARNLYVSIFGGAPFDQGSYPSYERFSASARAHQFAGPLLQQFTSTDAHHAVEMDQVLKQANVPTELRFFPNETHLFWNPRHRAVAMEENIDWFNYWLIGRRDPDPAKAEQYRRWDAMAVRWHGEASRASTPEARVHTTVPGARGDR